MLADRSESPGVMFGHRMMLPTRFASVLQLLAQPLPSLKASLLKAKYRSILFCQSWREFFSSRFLFSAERPVAITVASYYVSVALRVLIDRPESSGVLLGHRQTSRDQLPNN